ncbi:hypothetical protein Clacol_003175 [Clathrus columnatus]|uniref:Uncharacterized protein n=1 Tax=Clathrus columnatus TaxID=1419009 RepID=A0AAV5A3W3_9AGAM|nr:hypothetical protein Clacol_003175 [Clathrus columnatus]
MVSKGPAKERVSSFTSTLLRWRFSKKTRFHKKRRRSSHVAVESTESTLNEVPFSPIPSPIRPSHSAASIHSLPSNVKDANEYYFHSILPLRLEKERQIQDMGTEIRDMQIKIEEMGKAFQEHLGRLVQEKETVFQEMVKVLQEMEKGKEQRNLRFKDFVQRVRDFKQREKDFEEKEKETAKDSFLNELLELGETLQ